jgi:bidirectional [NiFe] hydrogenase diaphorase subunit
MRVVTLTIDGHDVSGRDDETILDVARGHQIEIPTLCQLDGISAWGGCRLCLVEVDGKPKLQPACTTLVSEGQVINTDSPKLKNYRKMIVEMLFTEGNHICSVCVSNNNCELQSMAHSLGIDHINLPYLYPQRQVDATHQYFSMDANRCILCTRCVRVCDEVEGAHTWDVQKRGIESRLIADLNQPWGEATSCTSCGKCVESCPTGALFEKGKGMGEMEKHPHFLTYLAEMKQEKNNHD